MNFIGGVEGMNFTPISGYNNYLKNSAAFEVDAGSDFQSILNNQTNAINNNPPQIKSGIEMNLNFDDLMAQSVQGAANDSNSTGGFMKSFGGAISGGLQSVSNANHAADKAQEALAMGEDVSVHDVMIAAEKSNLSMQMALQLRNKMMAAYTEINGIRV